MVEEIKDMETDELLDEIAEAEARLKALRAELQSRKSAEILKMRAELEAKAAALGVTLNDLLASNGKKKRQPAAPKYRDPVDNGLTWTGRGKQPGWLKEKIEAGASLEDFLIDKPAATGVDPEAGF